MTFIIDETHDPALESWVVSARGHAEFPVQNLPLGVFSREGRVPRIGVAIGDRILDLLALAEAGLLPDTLNAALCESTLNAFFDLPSLERIALRRRLSAWLSREDGRAVCEGALVPADACRMHVPFAIGDYTDFYVGIHHATNIGKLFRPDNPLLPNYKYVPIGYHGRASSIRVSGVPVVRPIGQCAPQAPETRPAVKPSTRLDYELELGVWIAGSNPLGTPVPIAEAPQRVGGFCLLNDWSARDIQAWEYQPLGPFLSKNFHSTISPWVVTAEAMAPFRATAMQRAAEDPRPLDYLWDDGDQSAGGISVDLHVWFASRAMREAGMEPFPLTRSSAGHMYWTVAQMIAHHSVNGCNLSSGDLLGTGTISGPTKDSTGSLMEYTLGGKEPLTLPTGETRTFLEDGDALSISARAHAEGYVPIGFGACSAEIVAAGN